MKTTSHPVEFNKVTWYSKLAAALFLLLIVPIWTFYIGMQYQETVHTIDESAALKPAEYVKPAQPDISTWQTYSNELYSFEIKYPADWKISVKNLPHVGPSINIYKEPLSLALPLTHHSNETQVSIFPHGIPTEGVVGTTKTTTMQFSEPTKQAVDYTLAGGKIWASYINFTKPPQTWQPWGFLWASTKIDNLTTYCEVEDQPVGDEQCDLGSGGGGVITRTGEINATDAAIVRKILSTFRFI